jgi:hypothetical protein
MRIRIQLTTLMWSRILILFDADQDPDFLVMRIRIRVPKIMRIRIHNTAFNYRLHLGSTLFIFNYSVSCVTTPRL